MFIECIECRQLDAAVDKLSKQIRGLTNLTLKVVSAQPLSATSRHTAPFFPLPHPLAGAGLGADAARIPRCLEPTELLLQLEGSGMSLPFVFSSFQSTLLAACIHPLQADKSCRVCPCSENATVQLH